jgi:hypothetical protein
VPRNKVCTKAFLISSVVPYSMSDSEHRSDCQSSQRVARNQFVLVGITNTSLVAELSNANVSPSD